MEPTSSRRRWAFKGRGAIGPRALSATRGAGGATRLRGSKDPGRTPSRRGKTNRSRVRGPRIAGGRKCDTGRRDEGSRRLGRRPPFAARPDAAPLGRPDFGQVALRHGRGGMSRGCATGRSIARLGTSAPAISPASGQRSAPGHATFLSGPGGFGPLGIGFEPRAGRVPRAWERARARGLASMRSVRGGSGHLKTPPRRAVPRRVIHFSSPGQP